MQEACVFALMHLPQGELRKILLKGSIRMIKSLIIAYPQAMGPAFLDALAPAINPATLQVLVEEVSRGQILTPSQVRSAECEFLKLINEEKVLPAALVC
jgi:hypothetical protein